MAKLTDKIVRELKPPERGNVIAYCEALKGFGCRVTRAGTKAFVLNYRFEGRERRITIGGYPAWSVAAAREKAEALRRQIDNGSDPLKLREDRAAAPTVADLFLRYEKEHLPRKAQRSANDDKSMWQKIILPRLGRMKLDDLTFRDVDALHRFVSEDRPVRANRVIEVLKKGLNLAVRWEWISQNPAIGITKNREQPRHRYLSGEEVGFVMAALDAHHETLSAEAIRLLVLTGARKSEVLQMEWSQVDLRNNVWTKPSHHTKQRREHRVPLSSAAADTLAALRSKGLSRRFVFPSAVENQPIKDVKKSWESIRRRATLTAWRAQGDLDMAIAAASNSTNGGELDRIAAHAEEHGIELRTDLRDVRIHDLRHTYASLLIAGGIPLAQIGALLGHTQAQTTHRYAHLSDDPLRAATEIAAATVQRRSVDK